MSIERGGYTFFGSLQNVHQTNFGQFDIGKVPYPAEITPSRLRLHRFNKWLKMTTKKSSFNDMFYVGPMHAP